MLQLENRKQQTEDQVLFRENISYFFKYAYHFLQYKILTYIYIVFTGS